MGQKLSVAERIHKAAKLNDLGELQVRRACSSTGSCPRWAPTSPHLPAALRPAVGMMMPPRVKQHTELNLRHACAGSVCGHAT